MTTNRLFPLTGLAAVVITLIVHSLHGGIPNDHASAAAITAYYRAHHSDMLLSASLFTYAGLAFVAFSAALRRAGMTSALGFAGAAILAAAFAVEGGLAYALGHHPNALDPTAAQALHVVFFDLWMPIALGGAMFLFGTAAVLRGRPLGWTALVVGVVTLVPEPVGDLGFILLGVWTVVTSIGLATQRVETTRDSDAGEAVAGAALVS